MGDLGESLMRKLTKAVGADGVLASQDIDGRYLHDWMVEAAPGSVLAVLRPRTTEAVSRALAACYSHGVPVVPQGGRTGLAGGATPVEGCVVLSMERMSGIIEIDRASATLTAWAGTPLQVIQEAASEAGLFLALDIGGRGSCQIGGNISTNAGGNRVLRWGMARDQVLGLEVVLANGSVLTQLNKMLKNNAGYDLKQLFIGSEGTLGVVTRVVLRLQAAPKSLSTAMLSITTFSEVIRVLCDLRAGLGSNLAAFEVMWPDFYELVTTRVAGLARPLPLGFGAYVIVESMGFDPARDPQRFEEVLSAILEAELATDAVIAQSDAQREALWRVRDASGELRHCFWPHVMFDVSVPVGDLGTFAEELITSLRYRWPEVQTALFGHAADANIHIGVKVGDGEQPESQIEQLVYAVVARWSGSISAEHGIGLLKRAYLGLTRSAAEIEVMRVIRNALDPRGILNPGKIFVPRNVDSDDAPPDTSRQ